MTLICCYAHVCSEGLEGGHMSAGTCVAPLAWPHWRAANCRITTLYPHPNRFKSGKKA
jgi:hypothetical protein